MLSEMDYDLAAAVRPCLRYLSSPTGILNQLKEAAELVMPGT